MGNNSYFILRKENIIFVQKLVLNDMKVTRMNTMRMVLTGLLAVLLVACTKEGDTIYQPNPNEEAASTVPLITVIYGPGDLGDRRYCDLIYAGVEKAAATYGVRSM